MRYECGNQRRLQAVAQAGALNAIRFVDVIDRDAPTLALRQRTLLVFLLQPAGGLGAPNVIIDGGVRFPSVGVDWAVPGSALPAAESPTLLAGIDDPDRVLVVRTNGTGDHSCYTLRLVAPGSRLPPAGFDPKLASVGLDFKVECLSDFDCAGHCLCRTTVQATPTIDYLAKDYGSFRQLMLDRMSLLAPDWTERHSADLGVALIELLAYAADQLSYRQDAAATEAYLGTARSRISLRRHARLVDYQISEGCNARVYVQIAVNAAGVTVPAGTRLLTAAAALPARVAPGDPALADVLDSGTVEVFETVEPALLDATLASLRFWTWGELDYCLPVGATSATLVGAHPALRAGDVLLLTEEVSPTTGQSADADPTHRAAMRLTSVVVGSDPSGGRFKPVPDASATDITSISWDPQDALTFPLCVTAQNGQLVVGAALGNIVLADHGRTVDADQLGPVPPATRTYAPSPRCGCGSDPDDDFGGVQGTAGDEVAVRFRPALAHTPLTFAAPPEPAPLFSEPVAAAPVADLAALNLTPAVQSWVQGHRLVFDAGPAILTGLQAPPAATGLTGDWSISDGVTIVRISRVDGELLIRTRRAPASSALVIDPRAARPALAVAERASGLAWTAQPDLLASDGSQRHLMVEIDTDRTARLRFGDGEHGRRPPSGVTFDATYRLGNGTAGNVGASALAHVVSANTAVVGVANPMPAAGGTEPQTAAAIRRDAPQAYLVQQRAVTEADYASMAARTPGVAKAVGTFRWTGSWYTAFVTADRLGGAGVDQRFENRLVADLDAYRMAGYDMQVDDPRPVPLRIKLAVCVLPGHLRGAVHQELLTRLGAGVLPDGRLALFHPDNFTFGQPVYLSTVYAVAQETPGVQSVTVTAFERLLDDDGTGLDTGRLPMGRLEIARLDNDPDYPDRGVLTVSLGGGR